MSQSPLILVRPKTQVMCRPSPVWIVNLDPAASAKSRANKLVLHTALMLQPATGFSSCFRYPFQTCIMSTGSSVGLKGIGREILESLLFLENLFLPQEIPKVRPNPRFAVVVMNRDWPGKQLEKNYILRILSYLCISDDTTKKLVDNDCLRRQEGRISVVWK